MEALIQHVDTEEKDKEEGKEEDEEEDNYDTQMRLITDNRFDPAYANPKNLPRDIEKETDVNSGMVFTNPKWIDSPTSSISEEGDLES